MAKILYPEGSEVQIRNWKLRELRNDNHTYDSRKRVVKAYHRGDSRPYELQGVKGRFAVDELKRYRSSGIANMATPDFDMEERVAEPAYMTRSEVEAAVYEMANALEQSMESKVSTLHDHLVEDARIVAQESIDSNRDNDA